MMARGCRPSRWWEPLLPAGLWLLAAERVLGMARELRRLGVWWPRSIFAILRVSARLSRAGFNSWRFWGRKWR